MVRILLHLYYYCCVSFQLLDDILQEVSNIRVALEDDCKEHVRNVMFDMIRLRSPIVNSLFPVTRPHGIIRRS